MSELAQTRYRIYFHFYPHYTRRAQFSRCATVCEVETQTGTRALGHYLKDLSPELVPTEVAKDKRKRPAGVRAECSPKASVCSVLTFIFHPGLLFQAIL